MNKYKKLWRKLQRQGWTYYKTEGAKGIFSYSGHEKAGWVGRMLAEWLPEDGLILDVGCGCLPVPEYMKALGVHRFVGVDPYEGDRKRAFPFKKGVGEALPFEDGMFVAVLFATSLDHCWNPHKAIEETRRVLQPKGKLIVWYTRRKGSAYRKWKAGRGARLFSKLHQWAWDDEAMAKMISKRGFKVEMLLRRGKGIRLLMAVKEP